MSRNATVRISAILATVVAALLGQAPATAAQPIPLAQSTPPAQPTSPAQPAPQAEIEARAIDTPRVVRGSDGQLHLAYELRITSFYDDDKPLQLERVAVFADDATRPIVTYEGTALKALLSQSPQSDASDAIPIAAGRQKTLFFWLTLPEDKGQGPRFLRHDIEFKAPNNAHAEADDVRVAVDPSDPVVIGPPLAHGRWLVNEGPGNPQSHHWGSLVAVNGALTIPQRFAIDWFGLDDANHSVRGQHDSLAATTDADWIGYGSDVLAVADGVVVDARDGIPNGTPLAPQAVADDDLTARTLYGNFVILKIGPHIYAHYAHMQTGSVAVKIGEHVRRGAVIGHLGQTGAAGAPHLHFHVSDEATFEKSEGLPFVIDRFTLKGQGDIGDTFDPSKPALLDLPSAQPRTAAMPLDGNVVTFP